MTRRVNRTPRSTNKTPYFLHKRFFSSLKTSNCSYSCNRNFWNFANGLVTRNYSRVNNFAEVAIPSQPRTKSFCIYDGRKSIRYRHTFNDCSGPDKTFCLSSKCKRSLNSGRRKVRKSSSRHLTINYNRGFSSDISRTRNRKSRNTTLNSSSLSKTSPSRLNHSRRLEHYSSTSYSFLQAAVKFSSHFTLNNRSFQKSNSFHCLTKTRNG